IHVARRPTLVELNVPALGPSQPCQFLPESPNVRLIFRVAFRVGHQDANPPHLTGLLRPRSERQRRRRAATQCDELAQLYRCNNWITSSERATIVGGTSKPKSLAVFRLTTNSNLVPCCTGRSAVFAPLRILSTKLAERYHMSLMLAEYENRQPASAISRGPQISGRRWRAAAAAIAAREAMIVASSSTNTASAGHARIDAKLCSESSYPCTCKTR